ncbi:ABC transporter substrate-binding protein [Natrinema zhouii]|uniref:ABC transporter substrate-binding protein n=1 Tax=Natrinema zhouii TaxID=1710539 RepID=A0A7D6GV82_9EURY|nr:ABC transporter substrate-binding protein [Natrinema zhouii]QLK25566.1 ABC transporter substrate-binding protein [Natrinema zhouii]
MNWSPTPSKDGTSRRSFLAAGAAGAAIATSGCLNNVRSVVSRTGNDQLSLTITTIPAEGDRQGIQIARRLEKNLEKVGIATSLDMRSRSELLETVLIEHDFDIYVGHHPADYDPDFLYETLHSTFANESGWQNPFGFTSWAFDALLDAQRRAEGDDRIQKVQSVLKALAQEKPFDPICMPDEHRVARAGRFDGWDEADLSTRHGYLGLEPADGVNQLHALKNDARATNNLNPLSATMRERNTTIDLLFDSLATVNNGEVEQWLAKSWDWTEPDDSDPESNLTATVTLHEDCQFHDGEPLTAEDVAFTYRFLKDTSLGRTPTSSPAPRYQGHVNVIDNISIDDDAVDGMYELQFSFNGSRETAKRAFTVPILPKHYWHDLVDRRASSGDFTAPQGRWLAVTGNHIPPIGSGPFQFDSRTADEELRLTRYEDHFTLRDDNELPEPTVDELRFDIDPSSASSIRRVAGGSADVTASVLAAYTIGAIPDTSDIERLQTPSQTFYHLGFNVRNAPFSNTHFRRAITQLIDKEAIAKEVFYGNATPVATPVTDEWVPESLEWNGEDPVMPFVGSDGELNVEAAKASFETAGFRYDDNGRLLGGN